MPVLLLTLALLPLPGRVAPWGPEGQRPAGVFGNEVEAETVEVVASEKGFEPRVVNLRKGDPVRLRLTTSDREHCFALDAFRVEKRIVPGRATFVDLTPEKAGTFAFQCCIEQGAAADKEHGRLVVVE